MSRTSGSKKTPAASSSKSQGGGLLNYFGKPSAPSASSTSAGLRPATARLKKEKGRPPERTSPRLARKRNDQESVSTSAPKKNLVVYVDLPSRSTSRNSRASPLPREDTLPAPPRPRLDSTASVMSESTSLNDLSSELGALTSTEDERAASPVPEPPTITRGTARKRKVAELPFTPTPTKKSTGRLPSAAKKPRLASPPADSEDDMVVLPSSQSDELYVSLGAEMDVDPPADPWRIDDEDAGPSSSHPPTSSPHSPRTPERTQTTQRQTQTPPPTITLDSKTETNMKLAEMRKEARRVAEAEAAKRAAEDEDKFKFDFQDVLSESSDEEEPDFLKTFRKGKGKASPRESSPSPSSPMVTSSPLATQRPKRERKQATRRPAVLVAESKAAERRKTSANPLDTLLREKKQGERKGTGEAALQSAELRESSAETELNMDDVEAATRLAQEGFERAYSGVAYQDDGPQELDMAKSKKTTIKLLGAEAGKAAMKIIEADRLAVPEEGRSTRPIEIWAHVMGETSGDEMDVDEAALPFPVWDAFASESKGMIALKEAWVNNAYPDAVDFINPGLLGLQVLKTSLPVLRSLAALALTVRPDDAPKKACQALGNMAKKVPEGQAIPFSASLIAQTLAGLGLKAELVNMIWSDASASQPSRAKTKQERQEILRVMVTLVKTYIVAGGSIPDDEISGVVMAFLFIANDAETAPSLRNVAISAVDSVLDLLSGDNDESRRLEVLVARNIWSYASSQTPPCQRSIMNSFAIANRPSMRICRRVACHLLLETPPPADPNEYLTLPPLKPIIALLRRTHSGPFETTPQTDYYALEARADVLNKMLIGMGEYVAQDHSKTGLLSSTEAMEHKITAPLEQLKDALKKLAAGIQDTRAAHLDRSSAKSWIQMVELRVHYQREGMQNAHSKGGRKGPRKITDMLGVASSSRGTSAAVSREASAAPGGSGSGGGDGMAIGV